MQSELSMVISSVGLITDMNSKICCDAIWKCFDGGSYMLYTSDRLPLVKVRSPKPPTNRPKLPQKHHSRKISSIISVKHFCQVE